MSRCTCRVTPASWPCAWTWTSRSSPRTCRRPVAAAGIYGTLIPILQQWNQQYDFVGSYYINIGDNPTAADPSTTNWTDEPALLPSALGDGERDRHPLVHPPHQSTDRDIHGDHLRRYAGRLDHDHFDRCCRRPSPASRWACLSRLPTARLVRTRRSPAPPEKVGPSPTRRSPRFQATPSRSATSQAASVARK